ncbi:MAG: FtsX-like permease family protein [Candidatus Dadabacteria bacterium]|nr:FtsX-like permease family protein [Candidatus Dadabacteria bacterium]NIQ14427.1 FtsX-like permease family protein [Candidatus Dadabacteria bacterium]
MYPFLSLGISYKAIKSNKIRSFLTTLGIIIGVAAVISLVSITQGAKKMIESQLTNLGGKSLVVNSGIRTKSFKTEKKNVKPLTKKDAKAIRDIKVIKYVSEIINTTSNVISGNRNIFTVVVGTSPEFTMINDWHPQRGTYFNNLDVKDASLVCVLGTTVKNALFGNSNAIGKKIRIGKYTYRVIGVMSTLGQTPSGKDQDDVILLPYSSVQKRLIGSNRLSKISVSVDSSGDLNLAKEEISKVLRQQHNLNKNSPDDFYIKSQQNQIKTIKNISKIMTILLGSIASISLIVGGIGIMNIMLVSVGERTREIGIRMAVGANEKDIMTQFLVESIMLSLIGGLIGIIFGILISKTANYITNWPTQISIVSILIAFFFAAFVGIIFGIYPAKKASKLNPIDALRYE